MSIARQYVVAMLLGISPPLVGRLRSQYPAGISCRDRIVRNTLGYYAPCANDNVAPNLDTRKYHCVGTNPHVIAYLYWVFWIMAIVVILAMIGTYYADVDTDSHVGAEDDAIPALDVAAGIVARIHPVSESNSVVMEYY